MGEHDAIEDINPVIIRKRKEAPLYKYLSTENIGGAKYSLLIRPIGQEEINKDIETLAAMTSVGKDNITDEVIKQNQEWMVPPIEILLQNSQLTRKLPKQWIKGVLAYIHKKKDTKDIKNYRPITLLTTIYKIWDIIMAKD